MVRKSGPVQTARFGSWLIGLLAMLLIIIMLALVGAGYLFLQQSKVLAEFGEHMNLLMLRAERLEYLVQEQETRELIALEQSQAKVEAENAAKPKTPVMASLETGETPLIPVETPTSAPEDNPKNSKIVSINGIDQRIVGSELLVNYDVTNEQGEGNRAEGYVSLILHCTKDGKSRLEASPPMRLDAKGRPVSYRRGMPFAVHRFRRIAARFDVEGKIPQRLEFVVYSRRGQLLLVHDQSVTAKAEPTPSPTPIATQQPAQEPLTTQTAQPTIEPQTTGAP